MSRHVIICQVNHTKDAKQKDLTQHEHQGRKLYSLLSKEMATKSLGNLRKIDLAVTELNEKRFEL